MNLLRIAAVALAVTVLSTAAHAQDWLTSYADAERAAQQSGKPIMLFFTGSDWCGWCKKLQAEILTKDEFKSYAQNKLILMEVDFPRGKSQPADVKDQNQKLQEKYEIQGYPTCVVVDAQGKPKGSLGYMQGGPKAFIDELERIAKN